MTRNLEWSVKREVVMPKRDNPMGNNFYGYRKVDLGLPDGRLATYHGVIVGDCVHVVAIENDLTTYLVRQKRPNVVQVGQSVIPETLEFPGGFADPELGLEASAQKELNQEINRHADTLTKLGVLYPSTGVSDEQDTVFLGTELTLIAPELERESTEQDMRIISGKFGDLMDRLHRSETPVSAQTLAAFALAAHHL